MGQTKEELEEWYSGKDPWAYEATPDDAWRKQVIVHTANLFGPYARALDIGAGHGWITKDLPASTRHALELSDNAAASMAPFVTRVLVPDGVYDLVIATGVLYAQYDWAEMVSDINKAACKIVLTCNIKAWELPAAISGIPGRQVFETEFPYRTYIQKLRVFRL